MLPHRQQSQSSLSIALGMSSGLQLAFGVKQGLETQWYLASYNVKKHVLKDLECFGSAPLKGVENSIWTRDAVFGVNNRKNYVKEITGDLLRPP